MRVGEKARVVALNRPTHEDRTQWTGKEGLLVRRLNVPWTPDFGALWELQLDKENVVVFSESELSVVKPDGTLVSSGIEDVREDWGDAPRVPSQPFRRFGSGSGTAPAVLALFVFLLAGVLLLVAGVTEHSWALGAAGGVLALIGIGAAGVLIT
jgi:hypothetical protein